MHMRGLGTTCRLLSVTLSFVPLSPHQTIGRELAAKKTASRASRVVKGLKLVAVVGTAVAVVCGAYFAGRALVRKWQPGTT